MEEIIKIFLSALTPIGELRLAIPLGLGVYKLPWWQVYTIAVIGNMIPPLLILWLFPRISNWLNKKSKSFHRFFNWLILRTRKKTEKKIDRYGVMALVIFVAIPLPNTGAWTGALAAWIFGLPFKKSIGAIFIGVLVAGIIVSLITLGAVKLPI
jgi:uncharacterized membrane protein